MIHKDNAHVGTRLGLVVNADRSLHLCVDGKDQEIVTPDVPDPCYFAFDLWSHCTKVAYCIGSVSLLIVSIVRVVVVVPCMFSNVFRSISNFAQKYAVFV